MYMQEITISVHQPVHCARKHRTSSLPQMMTAAACLAMALAMLILIVTTIPNTEKVTEHIPEASSPSVPVQTLDAVEVSYEAPQAEELLVGNFYEVPACDTSFKSFMDWRTITSSTSEQWQIQHSEHTWTDSDGFRRYGDCYLVALGTYYSSSCGDVFKITLDTGETFLAMTGDIKADVHTDAKHQLRVVGNTKNLVEFIVDSDVISASCWKTGDMSYAGNSHMAGNIAAIEKIS